MDAKFVTLCTLRNLPQADALVSALQGHGVDAVLSGEYLASMGYFLGSQPVRIQVPGDQLEEARALLVAFEEGAAAAEED